MCTLKRILMLTVGLIVVGGLFLAGGGFEVEHDRITSVEGEEEIPIIPDVPRDAIPPLDNPKYERVDEASEWLSDDDIVIGVAHNGDARAYPVKLMNWHEIVNETIGGQAVAVTYCPLCNSSVTFSRELDGRLLSFGNTGALYQSAMVMYDRQTESYWYHINGEAIRGALKGARLELFPSSIATWAEWKERWPQTQVLSLDTGYRRNYLTDPYRGYDAPESPPAFPVTVSSDLLPPKERVVGITINGERKAYPIRALQGRTVTDVVGEQKVQLMGNQSGSGAEVFFIHEDGTREPAPSTQAFWFAWFAAHEDTSVYGLAHGQGTLE